MKKKLRIRRRLCCSVVAILSLFAVSSNSLYAANNNGSGGIPIDANGSLQSVQVQEPEIGTKAPDFTVMKNGESVNLAGLGPQLKVLSFSSSAASRKMDADIAKLEELYKEVDIVFVNISIDENEDIAKQYGVDTPPAVFIISAADIILDIEKGNVDLVKKMEERFNR